MSKWKEQWGFLWIMIGLFSGASVIVLAFIAYLCNV